MGLLDEPYPNDEYELMISECPCPGHECYELTEDGGLCIACRNGACPPEDE